MAVVAVPLALGALGAWAAPAGYAAIGFAIGSAIGSYLVAPTVQTEGPRLTDNSFQSSQYGVPINRVYGRFDIKGQVIWSSVIKEHSKTEDVGGKGGGGNEQTTFTYTVSFAILLCRGEISAIRKIYVDGGLVYDISDTASFATFFESFEKFDRLKVYTGSETQIADPIIQSYLGVDDVPGYRGWSYIVFEDLDITDYGRRPIIEAEVVVGIDPVFENSGNFDHGFDLIDGPDDFRVNNGILKFAYPTNRRFVAPYIGRAYSMQILQEDQTATKQFYNYEGLPGYSFCISHIIGRIGGLSVVSDHATSGSTNHPLGNVIRAVRIGGFVYYDINKKVYPVCSNDESILYIFVYDLTNTFLFMDVYDQSLNLLYNGTGPSVKNDPTSSESASIDNGKELWHYDTGLNILYIYKINDDYSLTFIESTNTQIPDLNTAAVSYVKNNMFFQVGRFVWTATARGRLGNDSSVDLADIVSEICADADLLSSDIDVTDLVGILVTGYRISTVSTARSQLEPLQIAYNFDAVEASGKIKFVLRGNSPTKTLTVDNIGAGNEEPINESLQVKRNDDAQLPRRVTVTYSSNNINGEIGSQYASRISPVRSISEAVIEIPIILTDQKASQIAEIQLFQAWNERTPILFSSNDTDVIPTDVINIDIENKIYTVRIVSVNHQSVIGPVNCESVLEDISIYTPVAVGSDTSSTTQGLSPDGETRLEVFDVPLILAQDGEDGFYFAAHGFFDNWPGTVLMISYDNAIWSQLASITSDATIGRTKDVLADAITTVSDETNTVTVFLDNGSLSSVTESQWLNGANAAIIADEIVLFKTAALVAANQYELSSLIRGIKGTEQETGNHAIGDRFVLLKSSSVARGVISTDKIGSTVFLKPVTIGDTIENTDTLELTYAGNGYKPFAPAHLLAVDAGGGNYDITWIRRARKNGEWRDYVDVPLNEETESYRVEVWRSGSLNSTTDVSTESATVAAQTADVIKVAQLSAIVGPGYYSEVTI